jgi:hypothetical protein
MRARPTHSGSVCRSNGVFDPERDDIDTRPYGLRLALIALVALAIGGALMPSVTGYRAGADDQASCIALRDAWSTRSAPAVAVAAPDAARAGTPGFRQQMTAYYARPDVRAAMAYSDWLDGAGACLAGARHRLFLTAAGLGVIGVMGVGSLLVAGARRRQTRPNLRQSPTETVGSLTQVRG